jgi:glutathione peroxidase-family protein
LSRTNLKGVGRDSESETLSRYCRFDLGRHAADGFRRRLRAAAESQLPRFAGRQNPIALPISGQGHSGGQYRQFLRLHLAIRRLEKLYANLKDKGLVVVGFPSNDFGEQEPGSSKEIADFCRLTYGVEFPMMGKTVVKGKDANPFYLQLAQLTGSQPKWNFHKYLINRDTRQVLAFGSSTTPDDPALIKKIDEFLK